MNQIKGIYNNIKWNLWEKDSLSKDLSMITLLLIVSMFV